MKIKSRNALLILVSALMITACQTSTQTPISHNQTTQTINIPVVEVILDSDGDGYSDEIDECPGTPMNIVTDERGCPVSGPAIGPLKMEYRAFFARGSSELSPEHQLELDKVAEKLQEYETVTMTIEGYASVDETSNVSLQPYSVSRYRALMVKNYLIMRHKIDPERLSAFSCGAKHPIASSETEEGKSMNRRVYGLAEELEDEAIYNQPSDSYINPCIEFK